MSIAKVLLVGVLAALCAGAVTCTAAHAADPEVPPPRAPAGQPAPRTLTLDLGKGLKMELLWIEPGTFTMGQRGLENERPHEVTLTRGFYMGRYEVTQEQYEVVMGENPSHFKGPRNPVEMVSWDKSKEFCARVAEKTGRAVQLPTEAQWEYACRAGTRTVYSCGDDVETLRRHAWISPTKDAIAEAPTKPVGSFLPNPFGLYDMHGNVYEWCIDWYDDAFYARSPAKDPVNLEEVIPPRRKEPWPCLRGGSAGSPPGKARSAYRNNYHRMGKHTIGFRVVVAQGEVAGADDVPPPRAR